MRIELAAIKYDGYIYVGLRHAWIRDMIFDILGRQDEQLRIDFCRNATSGFITSDGRFIDRDEALEIAFASGQINQTRGSVLCSEDLW